HGYVSTRFLFARCADSQCCEPAHRVYFSAPSPPKGAACGTFAGQESDGLLTAKELGSGPHSPRVSSTRRFRETRPDRRRAIHSPERHDREVSRAQARGGGSWGNHGFPHALPGGSVVDPAATDHGGDDLDRLELL